MADANVLCQECGHTGALLDVDPDNLPPCPSCGTDGSLQRERPPSEIAGDVENAINEAYNAWPPHVQKRFRETMSREMQNEPKEHQDRMRSVWGDGPEQQGR